MRIGELCRLTAADYQKAGKKNGSFTYQSERSQILVKSTLLPLAIKCIEKIIAERRPGYIYLFLLESQLYDNGARTPAPPSKGISVLKARETVQRVALMAYPKARGRYPLPVVCQPQAFRHWYARQAVAHRTSISRLQKTLGHVYYRTTNKIYGK